MGYYVKVESNVTLYVEDINEKGNKTIVFYMDGQEVMNFLNISMIT